MFFRRPRQNVNAGDCRRFAAGGFGKAEGFSGNAAFSHVGENTRFHIGAAVTVPVRKIGQRRIGKARSDPFKQRFMPV